ncbi:MAG: efflux RND transporter periplasmic adaptor subunit [Leptonema sp. (in: Bacteria)]|nr:efflux RND transporter periplasmic adaptor subunit [Leptonema sp. (in: bacteria)]
MNRLSKYLEEYNQRYIGPRLTKKTAIIILVLVLLVVGGFIWYTKPSTVADADTDIEYWTCPMHPQIKEKGPGQCPICHMDLVPKKKKVISTKEQHNHEHETIGEVEISKERQQLIGLRTSVAEIKDLHTSIRTTGRVAFDPELAVAIREYLSIVGDATLRGYAVTRLKMLGMGEEEIRSLPSRRKEYESLYLQGSGNTTWVYAALYQNDIGFVKPGMTAKIRLPGSSALEWQGTVRSVSPTVDPTTRNLQARIEIKNAKDLRPDMYVNVSILSDAGKGLVIPTDALVDTGHEQIVYVIRDKTNFSPRKIQVGREADEGIVVIGGLEAGEVVVSSATFLIDSESKLHGSF